MSTDKLIHDIPFVIEAVKRQAQREPAETYHTMTVAQSGKPKSILSSLTPEQRQALYEWADAQPRGNGGAVDLMAWPGWAELIMSGLEQVMSENRTTLAQDEYHNASADSSMLKFDVRAGKFVE